MGCGPRGIDRIAGAIDAQSEESLDAAGHLLLPGIIDPQVHFREPGGEHKEDLHTGSCAAVKGGVTTYLDMPNTAPALISQAALDDKLARAASRSVANYGFFIGATPSNLDEINTAEPVCGIKVFMGSSTGDLLVDRADDLERIFANGDRLIAVHAEDQARISERERRWAGATLPATHSKIRDVECARLATERALDLSRSYQRRLHILHLSTAAEIELLRQDKPPWVTAEVIPNHLFLTEGDYERLGTLVQMNPPIRSKQDAAALWAALRAGIIDFVATDHAPHTLAEKQRPYPDAPSGMPGVETSLPLMLTEMASNRCTLAQIQQWMCSGAARAYGIANKGAIQEGWDADLTLVDMDAYRPVRHRDMFTRVRWSPYDGRELTGWPVVTVVGGRIVYDHGHIREGLYGQALRFENIKLAQ